MKKFKFEIQAKLSDGTDIVFDGEFMVGTPVFVIDADGNKIPAPDAEHELEGGQKFKTEGGVITEIMVEEIPSEEVIVEELKEDKPEMKFVSDEEFLALVQTVQELQAKMDEVYAMKEGFELSKEQKLAEIELEKTNKKIEVKESKFDSMYRKIEMFKK